MLLWRAELHVKFVSVLKRSFVETSTDFIRVKLMKHGHCNLLCSGTSISKLCSYDRSVQILHPSLWQGLRGLKEGAGKEEPPTSTTQLILLTQMKAAAKSLTASTLASSLITVNNAELIWDLRFPKAGSTGEAGSVSFQTPTQSLNWSLALLPTASSLRFFLRVKA